MIRSFPTLRHMGFRDAVMYLGLAAISVMFVWYLSKLLAYGGSYAIIACVVVVGGVVVAFRPLAGLYACYALLLVVPAMQQKIDIPIFHSPLQAIALLTIGVAFLRFPMSGSRVPKSRVYMPTVIVLSLYVTEVLVHHGPDTYVRFYDFAAGGWPLLLIVLLVRTPRMARNVLVGMCATCVALTIIWLPGLLALSQSKSGVLGRQIRLGERFPGYTNNPAAVSLLGSVGALGVQTLVALALVAPVLLGVGLSSRKWRIMALFGYATISITIFTATIASAVATLMVGSVAALVLYAINPSKDRRGKITGLINVVMIVAVIAAVGLSLAPGREAFHRLTDPRQDFSGALRIQSLQQGWYAFWEKPFLGQGAYNTFSYTPRGYIMEGHNSWLVLASEYGLVGLVPWVWLLIAISRELWRLLRSSLSPLDMGIASGFLASFAGAFVTGFLTPTFAQVFQDTIIWTLVALAIVWNNWRKADPEAALIE